MMFSKGKHSRSKAQAHDGASRTFRTVGYALAGTALLGFSTVQSGLVNPQAIAETAAGGSTPTTDDANVNSTLAYSTAAAPSEKDETVYVFSKADGTVKNTKVSSELKNPDKAKTLKDQTDLSNLENTENDGEHATTSEGTVWETKGDDVYYMGDTDKQAPITMKVSYQLDGKAIAPDELLGKKGRVKVRFDFANKSYTWKTVNGKRAKIYTPFMALTGLMLDNDQFSNVKAKNAKVLDDGDRTIVAGYALPGLQESLDIDEDTYKVPSYLEFTADTTDFELGQTLTLVSNDLFNDVNADKLDSDELGDKIEQLQDGMDKLMDGSGDLVSGLNNLSNGAHTLNNGAVRLNAGAGTLAKGTGTLRASTKTLPGSVGKLNTGMKSLSTGIGSANTGAAKLAKGTGSLYSSLSLFKNGDSKQTGLKDALDGIGADGDQTSATLIGGVNLLKSGVDGYLKAAPATQKVVDDAITHNQNNIKGVLKTISESQDAIDSLNEQIEALPDDGTTVLASLKQQLATLQAKIAQARKSADAADAMLKKVSGTLSGLDTAALRSDATRAGTAAQTAGAQAARDKDAAVGAASAAAALKGVDVSALSEKDRATLAEAGEALGAASSELGSSATALAGSATSTAALVADVQGLSSALANLPSASDIASIQSSLDEVEALLSDQNLIKANAYISKLNTLVSNLDGDELTYDIAVLKQTYPQIEQALARDDLQASLKLAISNGLPSLQMLSQGLAQEKQGLISLRDGGKTADGRESSGISGAVKALGDKRTSNTLINGASQLDTGAGTLSRGLSTASSGAGKLAAGTKKLDAAAPQLYSGIVKLDGGAAQLASGTGSLASGAGKLAAGAQTAYQGGQKLADGLREYNRKGIEKIVDAYNDNLKGLSSRLDAVVDVGKGYTNFTGIEKGTKGKVKFVFETDSIEHDDDGE